MSAEHLLLFLIYLLITYSFNYLFLLLINYFYFIDEFYILIFTGERIY